jgi:hypothetical protein
MSQPLIGTEFGPTEEEDSDTVVCDTSRGSHHSGGFIKYLTLTKKCFIAGLSDAHCTEQLTAMALKLLGVRLANYWKGRWQYSYN